MLYVRIANEDGTISFHPLRENNIYVHCETCGSMVPVDDPINFNFLLINGRIQLGTCS